jgi:Fur family ferric uptake transcriptional regulator
MEAQVFSILKRNHLSVTESRKKILDLFIQAGTALAHHDIEAKTNERYDRVTVYRTLQTFMEKGIIHTIPTPDNSIKYALCREDCEEGHHHDNHVHFICESCGTATCLEDVHVPDISLPEGYRATQISMVVNGICRNCQ